MEMTGLTKENFFNSMKLHYPDAMLLFNAFIDLYKAENDWDELFNADRLNPGKGQLLTKAPKFHELPFELQLGIIIRFTRQYADFLQNNWRKDAILGVLKELCNSTREEIEEVKYLFTEVLKALN